MLFNYCKFSAPCKIHLPYHSELKVLVAAYAVSPYHSTYYRAASKPFNPLLGETYECIREDKGWRFIAEQVSNSFHLHADLPTNVFMYAH